MKPKSHFIYLKYVIIISLTLNIGACGPKFTRLYIGEKQPPSEVARLTLVGLGPKAWNNFCNDGTTLELIKSFDLTRGISWSGNLPIKDYQLLEFLPGDYELTFELINYTQTNKEISYDYDERIKQITTHDYDGRIKQTTTCNFVFSEPQNIKKYITLAKGEKHLAVAQYPDVIIFKKDDPHHKLKIDFNKAAVIKN